MHPCADEYEFVPVVEASAAAVLGCQAGERLVVRLFADGVPDELLTDGSRVLARFASGDSVLSVLHRRDERRWLTLTDGSETDQPCLLEGLVISELP